MKNQGIDKLIALGRKTYRITPTFLRFVFTPVRLIYILIGLLRADQWILIGEEVRSKQQLAILYYGIERNKNYFANLAFGGLQTENYIGKRWLWQVSRKVGDNNCSLVVTEIHRGMRKYFQKKGNVYIPQWTHLQVDIPSDISSYIKNDHLKTDLLAGNKSLKSDLRKLRNNGMSFEMTNNPEQYRSFYENMYVPYIRSTYGKMALLLSYQFFEREFPIYELLLVKKKDNPIAGILLAHEKNTSKLFALGVTDGRIEYVEDGVIGALYYFAFCYLREKGYQKVSLGGTRSFMKDGVLMYKKKWHPRIEGPSRYGFLLKVQSVTAGLKGFLINNPFIYLDGVRFNGAVFVDGNRPLDALTCEAVYKQHFLEGISRIFFYAFGEVNRGVLEAAPPQLSDKITISLAEDLFGSS